MKWFIYVLLIALVVIIQQSIFNDLNLGIYAPDLFLLIVLAIVWSTNNFDFLWFAVLGGFWTETTYGLPVGTMILSLIIVGSLAYIVINRWLFSDKSWQYFFGAVGIGTVLLHTWEWIYTSILFLFGWSDIVIVASMFAQSILPALAVNLLLTYPMFLAIELLVGYIQKRTRPQGMKL